MYLQRGEIQPPIFQEEEIICITVGRYRNLLRVSPTIKRQSSPPLPSSSSTYKEIGANHTAKERERERPLQSPIVVSYRGGQEV